MNIVLQMFENSAQGGRSDMLKDRIISGMSKFSPAQERLAQFVLDYPREAAFLTSTELGRRNGVSESSVVRFAYVLGYSGYPELREAAKELLLGQMSTVERMDDYEAMAGKRKSSPWDVLGADASDIKTAKDSVDFSEIKRFAEALIAAPCVYVAAQRSSFTLASFFSFYSSWFLPSVIVLDGSSWREKLHAAQDGSILFGISFPRYSQWTVDIMKFGKSIGHITLAVMTDSHVCPMTSSDPEYVITSPCSHVSFLDSFTVPMSVMNCLILSIAESLGDKAKKILTELEDSWSKDSVYAAAEYKMK
jgi:DNA-binding MurR/RpiR family transcriptional regulator